MLRVGFTIALALGLLTACGAASGGERGSEHPARAHAPPRSEATPRPWPEADALFRQDAHFLGGDAAYSVELSGNRRLWLFGDSFVADARDQRSRHGSKMVRSSVAIQHGADPSRARLQLFVRRDAGGKSGDFFPGSAQASHGSPDASSPRADAWEWPLHGIALGDALVLFTQRIASDAGALGFRAFGSGAYFVGDARGPPESWQLVPMALPERADLGLIGAAVLDQGEHVYVYAVRDPGDRALTLLRCARAALASGRFEGVEVFAGESAGFSTHARAQALLAPVANELSITRRAGGGIVLVHSQGFGRARIEAHLAESLTGPFSKPITLLDPPNDGSAQQLVYAAKAHAGLSGADLVVTYVESSLDAQRLLTDLELYFPRFLRITLPVSP